MEEKKQNISVARDNTAKSEEPKKVTYEQLEAYAAQTTEQAKRILQENQMLRKALYEQSLKEVELAHMIATNGTKSKVQLAKERKDNVKAKLKELQWLNG